MFLCYDTTIMKKGAVKGLAKKKNPNSNPKSGVIGFGLTALILASISGFSVPGIVAGVIVGLGIGKITSIMGSGLDTTTHNREDEERRKKEAEEEARRIQEQKNREAQEAASRIPLTGDPAADEVITRGQEMIKTIRQENEAITDPRLSSQMESICEKCEQIFRAVSEAPSKAPQVRKFMNYYLPTALKILANYRTMQDRGVSFQDLTAARDSAVRGLNMILTACQKQIDSLHKENMLDISTDIDVLEQMLKRDGYAENDFPGIHDDAPASEPRTAAEAQMRATSVPVMKFPADNSEENSGKRSSTRSAD